MRVKRPGKNQGFAVEYGAQTLTIAPIGLSYLSTCSGADAATRPPRLWKAICRLEPPLDMLQRTPDIYDYH